MPLLLRSVLTAADLVVLLRYDIDAVWAWLQVPVVALAWVAPWAWLRRRWILAGCCLLAMLGGLWGYLYLPPLIALMFAAVAFSSGVDWSIVTRRGSAVDPPTAAAPPR